MKRIQLLTCLFVLGACSLYASQKQSQKNNQSTKGNKPAKGKGLARPTGKSKSFDKDDDLLNAIIKDPEHQEALKRKAESGIKEKSYTLSLEEVKDINLLGDLFDEFERVRDSADRKILLDKVKEVIIRAKNKQGVFKFQSSNGNTLLHEIVLMQDAELCKLLLENKIDINSTNLKRTTPLLAAAFQNSDQKIEIMKMLLEAKADPNLKNENEDGPLGVVASNGENQAVKLLLEHGADIDSQNIHGQTALMFAIKNNKKRTAKQLLAAKADPNLQDEDGNTALMFIVNGFMDSKSDEGLIRKILEAGADPFLKNKENLTALDLAKKQQLENEESIKFLAAAMEKRLVAMEMQSFDKKVPKLGIKKKLNEAVLTGQELKQIENNSQEADMPADTTAQAPFIIDALDDSVQPETESEVSADNWWPVGWGELEPMPKIWADDWDEEAIARFLSRNN